MKKTITFLFLLSLSMMSFSQKVLTPELLWQLGRVTGKGLSKDGKQVVYTVTTPSISENKSKSELFSIPLDGGAVGDIVDGNLLLKDKNISPDGKFILFDKPVKIMKVKGDEFYPMLNKSNAYIFNDLNYRHWDEWEDGNFNHVILASLVDGQPTNEKDLMKDEPFDAPTQPFGGSEDYIWSPDGKSVVYVAKKKYGKEYAISTNNDLYQYDLATGETKNLTSSRLGYDNNPSFSSRGQLAWLSMKTDGYESDKQDLVVMEGGEIINLTGARDDLNVAAFLWGKSGNVIYFVAPLQSTEQLFSVDLQKPHTIRQITKGEFQVLNVVCDAGNKVVVSRADINHATELFTVDISNGTMQQLTHVNDEIYNSISLSKTELRSIKTTDGKKMPTWVVYPPGFDKNKKYPSLLYCLGGPQGTIPHYSFRWNLQLMAAQGYIVIAPDRRGVYGNGTQWAKSISREWGGQVMQDYLAAVDEISKEPFIDKERRGCVGASYGGYSAYMLESLHNGRFKTFIAHDGIFDIKSWTGTTEELWFANYDIGLPYWDTKNASAQKSYKKYSPSEFVNKWNTPILIIQGEKDYRVGVEQSLQAFQAAQLKGIKSRLLYFPDENHWVLTPQNALVWQHEFFKWLDETLIPPIESIKPSSGNSTKQ